MRLPIAIASLVSVSVALPVFADEPLAPPATTPVTTTPLSTTPVTAVPAFALMDVNGERSRLDTELALGIPIGGGDGVLYNMRLRGELMSRSGFGGYGSFVAGGFSDGPGLAAGNLELGGLYHATLSQSIDLGFHVGLILPTAGDEALGPAIATEIGRPSDLVMIARSEWIRIGVSPQVRDGAMFARADLGLDHALGSMADDDDTLLHLNAGVGVGGAHWSVAGELQVLFAPGGGESLTTTGISVHYNDGHISPFVALSTPLGNELSGEAITLAAGVGMIL